MSRMSRYGHVKLHRIRAWSTWYEYWGGLKGHCSRVFRSKITNHFAIKSWTSFKSCFTNVIHNHGHQYLPSTHSNTNSFKNGTVTLLSIDVLSVILVQFDRNCVHLLFPDSRFILTQCFVAVKLIPNTSIIRRKNSAEVFFFYITLEF